MSGTQFESHAGSASAKKWKTSLRIEPGSCPEVPPGLPAVLSAFSCCAEPGRLLGCLRRLRPISMRVGRRRCALLLLMHNARVHTPRAGMRLTVY